MAEKWCSKCDRRFTVEQDYINHHRFDDEDHLIWQLLFFPIFIVFSLLKMRRKGLVDIFYYLRVILTWGRYKGWPGQDSRGYRGPPLVDEFNGEVRFSLSG